ncbi:unnamed protein product [Rotaria sordida]|uniref:Glucosamine/galactosamine-6-phosphate isomerase domain-containing protein n=1 Tax=Rotaria sordida TaxID=392033 RepID=A0A814KTW9_9BILA|nr:unnamed protein product [Rotaria sordida]
MNENSIKLFFEKNEDSPSKGNVVTSDSTDTSADGDKSNSRKRRGDSTVDTMEHSVKHRKRQIRANKHNREPPLQRVTLTVDTINETKYKIVVVTGASKSTIVTEILEDDNNFFSRVWI